MIRFIRKYYPSILIAILIMWLSLSESGTIKPIKLMDFPNSDKVAHFSIYLFFTFIMLLNSSYWKISGRIKYFIIIIPTLLGLLLEIFQRLLTKTRQADFYDFLANFSGIALAAIFVFILSRLFKPKQALDN